MVNKIYVSCILLFLLLFFVGCITTNRVKIDSKFDMMTMKKAYVVKQDRTAGNVAVYISEYLMDKGYEVSSGLYSSRPGDADFYVTYTERWNREIIPFFCSLEIYLIDNKTGERIANGSYERKYFDGIKSPRKITETVLDSIFLRR